MKCDWTERERENRNGRMNPQMCLYCICKGRKNFLHQFVCQNSAPIQSITMIGMDRIKSNRSVILFYFDVSFDVPVSGLTNKTDYNTRAHVQR